MRLKHTVLKFGLKKLNISYSKISMSDIKQKLSLETVEETEQIVAKAIRDGVIDAVINHDEGFMQSREVTDIYSSNDPQHMLNKRIKFCMDLHSDAVKALEYPQKEGKRDQVRSRRRDIQHRCSSRLLRSSNFPIRFIQHTTSLQLTVTSS
jgi:26S proteasome regulatory subunit N3